jgi:hypothetical protein
LKELLVPAISRVGLDRPHGDKNQGDGHKPRTSGAEVCASSRVSHFDTGGARLAESRGQESVLAP